MTKLFFHILFLVFSLHSLTAQNKKTSLELRDEYGNTITVRNLGRFEFRDSQFIRHSGKIYLLNDSQFCFVNPFLERSGPVFHIRDIQQVNFSVPHKRTIPLGIKIAGALIIPYFGVAYLIVSEVLRASSGKSKRQGGWQGPEGLEKNIRGFYTEV